MAGLVFAAAGDTALLAGMALFPVAQVCYLWAWLTLGASAELRRRWWIAIALRLSGIGATVSAASDALIGLRIAHFTIPGRRVPGEPLRSC